MSERYEVGIPRSDTYPTTGGVVAELACAHHARFWRPFPYASDRIQSGLPHPQPPVFTHSLPPRATLLDETS